MKKRKLAKPPKPRPQVKSTEVRVAYDKMRYSRSGVKTSQSSETPLSPRDENGSSLMMKKSNMHL